MGQTTLTPGSNTVTNSESTWSRTFFVFTSDSLTIGLHPQSISFFSRTETLHTLDYIHMHIQDGVFKHRLIPRFLCKPWLE